MQTIKCVVVGDRAMDKTSLLYSYTESKSGKEITPVVFDTTVVMEEIDGQPVKIELWDTAGQEDYDSLRELSYKGTSVFILCFSLAHPTTFRSVRNKWYPELSRYSPGIPIILVAMTGEELPIITHLEGLNMARAICASGYVKHLLGSSVDADAVFDVGVRAVLNKQPLSMIVDNVSL